MTVLIILFYVCTIFCLCVLLFNFIICNIFPVDLRTMSVSSTSSSSSSSSSCSSCVEQCENKTSTSSGLYASFPLFTYTFNKDFGTPSTFVAPEARPYQRQLHVKILYEEDDQDFIIHLDLNCDLSDSIYTVARKHLVEYKVNFGNCIILAHRLNKSRNRIMSTRYIGWFSSVSNLKDDEILCIERNSIRTLFISYDFPAGICAVVRLLSGKMFYRTFTLETDDESCLSLQMTLKRDLRNDNYFRCYRHSFSCVYGRKHECMNDESYGMLDCIKPMEEYDFCWHGSGLTCGVLIFIEVELPFSTDSVPVDENNKNISM